MNPYRIMDIYNKENIDAYRGRELYENPPHLYAVSDAAYKAMKRRAKDTCIVISGLSFGYLPTIHVPDEMSEGPVSCVSGESGAGKTEASKYIMQYIAAITNPNQRVDVER